MTNSIKLKEAFEVESKHSAFFTGGNIEWLSENVLLCQKESSLQFLDTETGTVIKTIGLDEEDADIIHTFTANKTVIITTHKSGLLKQWNHEGVLEKQWRSIHKGPISKLALNRGGALASGGSDGAIRLWDIVHRTCTHNLKGCQGVVGTLEFHPEEELIFGGGDDTKVHSWNLTSGDLLHSFAGHFSKITSIAFDDSKHMITSGRDKVIILWHIHKGIALRTVPVFESLETVVVLPKAFKIGDTEYQDGLYVATAGETGRIRCWNVENSREIYTQTNSLVPKAVDEGGLSIIKLLFVQNQFAVVTVDHNILLHDLTSMECLKQFVGFSDEILDVCFVGTDDSHLAVATNSSDIKLYDNSTMNCRLLQGHTDIVLALAKTVADTNLLLSSSKDNSVRLWRLNPETTAMTCVGVGSKHTGSVGSIAFSQTSATFAVSVSQDTCVKVWQIPKSRDENQNTGDETHILECLRTEIAHQKDINCVTVSPNDKIIATGSQDKLCKLWTEHLELLGVLRGHKRGIWSVRFSPVDQVVITSSADCSVKLWSIAELNCLKTLEGHDSSVLKVEFLSNGMQILTAGADGFLKVFNVKTSECALTLDEHEGRVWALALKSDESTIVSGGSDSQLVKWKDTTLERRLQKTQEEEELALQTQQLNNLVQNNELLKALKLALRLDRPFQTLTIIHGLIKKGDTGLAEVIAQLGGDQKEALLKCATTWNMNSKHCQSAQLVLNILLNELQSGEFRPLGLSGVIESTLPYTERHYKRLTQLTQDLHFINYTVNCMQPFAKKTT